MAGSSGVSESGSAGPVARPTAAERLLERVGFGADPRGDARLGHRLVIGVLALYLVSFALHYPSLATNVDEAAYLHQARLILEGRSSVVQVDPFTGEERAVEPSTYAPGTALLMAPLVALFGFRGAYLVPLLGLVLAMGVTARWLDDEGRQPLFALVLPAFVPSLVMARVAMSDVPSLGVVALGLWLFWRGLDRGAGWWLASGYVAGASAAFRVSNPLLFVPLFAGTVLRRERRCLALVAGGVLGLASRALAMRWYFGEALFERDVYPLDLWGIPDRLPYYLLGLLVLIPGGLALATCYRGRRRPEVVATLLCFVSFFLFQEYSTSTTSVGKRVILSLRYLIPVTPLLAFAMAESAPRLWRLWLRRGSGRARRLAGVAATAVLLGVAGVGIAAAAVHPLFGSWERTQVEIRDAITRSVPDDAVLVTNWDATRKFVREVDRKFLEVQRHEVEPEDVSTLVDRHGTVFIALLDRSDSEYWLRNSEQNQRFVDALRVPAELLVDLQANASDRLRIWRAGAGPSSAAPTPPAGS